MFDKCWASVGDIICAHVIINDPNSKPLLGADMSVQSFMLKFMSPCFTDNHKEVLGASMSRLVQNRKKRLIGSSFQLQQEDGIKSLENILYERSVKNDETNFARKYRKLLTNSGVYQGMSPAMETAIRLYSTNELYDIFKVECEEMLPNNWQEFDHKEMWILLNNAIKTFGNFTSFVKVYRCINTQIDATIGQIYSFGQITTTSLSFQEVANFASEVRGTLLIINIRQGLDIHELSKYSEESEFILAATMKYKVTQTDSQRNYRIINLEQQ